MKAKFLTILVLVFFVQVALATGAVLNGTTFLTLGDEGYYVYNDVPFCVWAVSVIVEKTGDSFVPTQTIELCGRVADKIHILEAAGFSDNVPDGVVVGHINVYYTDGTSDAVDLVMGVNIAEWAYDRPETELYLQHTKVPPAFSWWTDTDSDDFYWGHYFYVSIETERKLLDYLELVLDPASYTNQQFYGGSPADWFGIGIHAITMEGILTVDAGDYQCIIWPTDTVNLDGTVATSPEGALPTSIWSKVSGPGEITFGNAGTEDTIATFSKSGDYVLRLTADDGTESVSDEVRIRVREEVTVDIDVVNPSFEFYEDGSQIICHMAIGHPELNPTGMDILGWTNIGDWAGVDVYCGAEGVCDDCRNWIALDGVAYGVMQANDTQLYQILDEQITANSQYTLTFDAISAWNYSVEIVPSLFYVDENGNHIDLAIKTIILNSDHLCNPSFGWDKGISLKFTSCSSSDYIGKSLGVKFRCPLPEYGDNWEWLSIDNVHVYMSAGEAQNVAPLADAGGPYISWATIWEGAVVKLDGSGSSDPDGYALIYEWDLDLAFDSDGDGDSTNDVDTTGPTPETFFMIGFTEIGLVVIDECGARSQQDVATATVSIFEVLIEIKSINNDPNDTINLGADGVVKVVFLTDEGFDATTVDPQTVVLRGEDFIDGLVKFRSKNEDVPMTEIQDIDGDGDIDFVVHLDTERLSEYELEVVCEIGALAWDEDNDEYIVVLGTDFIHLAPDQTGLE